MHAVVRTYNGHGAVALFDLLDSRRAEIEALIRKVPGLVSYEMIRTRVGGVSVTLCESKEGTDASVDVARDWIKANAGHLRVDPPMVSEGEVMVQIAAARQRA
ncbi:hypothetical protein M1105_09100 [Limibaculum sp. FT325]|uniref:hypothetical protein n=1 Tax=Thermohalobaculum sediminis TaxID=2939436 RepID=UPI0020BE66B0|nr:hypothetical protein [Limibaculum sediminis]MCL5777142.1 hypothetical protein [Limibaculum sediminis]